jgi:hypothetical protein
MADSESGDSGLEPQRTRGRRGLKRPLYRHRYGPFRPIARWDEALFPLTMTELERLAVNGVNLSSLTFLQKVLRQHYRLHGLLLLTIYGWIAIRARYPDFPVNDSRALLISIGLPVSLAIGLIEWRFRRSLIRDRMALNLIKLVRLLMKWDPPSVGEKVISKRYTAESKSQRLVGPYTRQLAWSFSRDIAVMCGQPSQCGSVKPWCYVGQAIAWCGERMSDPRRRAMLWELVPLLAEFFGDEIPTRPPPLIMTAATRVEVKPTKPMELLFVALRNPVVVGIVVGIIVALATAIFKLWFGK